MKTRRAHRVINSAFEALETRRLYAVAEPNGSFDLASVDTNNIYAEQNYTNSDGVASYDPDDYYKFYNLFGKSHLYTTLNGLGSDADLYVYDQNKNLIAQSRNAGNNSETINCDLAANQYFYVRVNKYGGGATSYNLNVYNDYSGSTLGTARDIGVALGQTSDKFEAYNKIFYGDYLDYRDNVDTVKFQLEAPGTISLRRLNVHNTLQTTVQLLDSSGNVLRNLGGSPDNGYNLADYPAPAGTYYMQMKQTSGAGEYSFRINADYAGATTATARDFGDLTGTSRNAKDMVGGAFLATYEDETDLYKFKLSKSGTVDFKLGINTDFFTTPTFGAKFGLARDLNNNGFIDSGEYITSFTNNGKTSQSLSAGTYYAVVSQNGAYTSYTLDMDNDLDSVTGDPKGYNNLSKATNAGTLSGESFYDNGFGVSNGDITDYYKFTLAAPGHFDASASINPYFSRDEGKPDMVVIKDTNNNGRYDGGEQVTPFSTGKISEDLGAGTYYLVLTGTGTQAAYQLRMVSDNSGNSLAKARAFASPSATAQTFNDYVEQNFGSGSDANDYYSFALTGSQTITLSTTGVAGEDIAMQLIQDKNSNGKVDSGEILTASDKVDSPVESITKALGAGKYFARVYGVNGGTNYSIKLATGGSTTPTPTSDPDDTIGEVKNVAKQTKKIGEFADFTLDTKTDVDLIRFDAKVGNRVAFQTESRSGSSINTFLRLFDGNGNPIASNNDRSTTNKFSYLPFTFTKAGTYYVGVSLNPNKSYNITTGNGDVAGTTTGAYRFRVLNTAPSVSAGSPFSSSAVSENAGSDPIV